MRVYATTLWLSAEKGTRPILATIASWITAAERRHTSLASSQSAPAWRLRSSGQHASRSLSTDVVTAEDLSKPGMRPLASGARLEVVYTEEGSPYLHAIRYTHRDRTERGRSWVTEIGLRAEAGSEEIECSVYLYTDEVSTRVSAPVQATRPLLVRELLRRCSPTSRTSGRAIIELTEGAAPAIAGLARNTSRTGALVVVSPRSDGSYDVAIDRLQDLLAGLATVVRIPATEDTRTLATIVGDGLTPYAGAIAVLFPVRQGPYAAPVPVRRVIPAEIDSIRAAGKSVEDEIFTLVTERMNVQNARRHLSPDAVNRERARRSKVQRARGDASADDLRTWNNELERDKARLEEELRKIERESSDDDLMIEMLSEELDQNKEELYTVRNSLSACTAQLSASRDGRAGGAMRSGANNSLRTAFSRVLKQQPTPEDSLVLLDAIYGDRVVILESAFESSRESEAFRDGNKVLDLLCKLAGPYWEALSAGQPDAEARKAFPPKRFAAKESETLSASGRAKRTFMYKGNPVVMEAHLKAGDTGGSPDTTIRIHFFWDASEHRIVIGYCGPHISF